MVKAREVAPIGTSVDAVDILFLSNLGRMGFLERRVLIAPRASNPTVNGGQAPGS